MLNVLSMIQLCAPPPHNPTSRGSAYLAVTTEETSSESKSEPSISVVTPFIDIITSEELQRKHEHVSKDKEEEHNEHIEMFITIVEILIFGQCQSHDLRGKIKDVNAIPQHPPLLVRCIKNAEMTEYLLSQGAEITEEVLQQAIPHTTPRCS